MKEYLSIYDENNVSLNEIKERKIVHEQGLWHREIAVYILNEKNELLIQKRAATKKLAANKWALCAGHIEASETIIEAAMREVEEEVGIKNLSPADFNGETNTYPRKGHIPTSENVFFGSHSDPATRLLLDDEILRATFEKLGALDPSKKVITYCGGGIAATWNALLLNKLGQENVAIYDGSMNEWAADATCPLVTKK